VSISKKRGGPSHRVKRDKNDPYPFPNDWFEWVVVTIALSAIGAGAYTMYYLSDMT
jgi:hypothetical protein